MAKLAKLPFRELKRQGKKVDDFSDAKADNYIELNGIKSELVIVEAEV